jgi:amino acid adenylation domain-containing protein
MPDTQAVDPIAGYEAPPSFGQERLHVMEMLRPGRSAYAMSYALRLDGPLIPTLAHQAIAAILARHDGLRATFLATADALQLFVRDLLPLDLPLVDVGGLSAAAQADAVRAALRAMTLEPFDLAAGPLIRFRLIRLGPAAHVLGLAVHHALADGQSLHLFRREFMTAYADLARGRPLSLPDLPIQFADFAEWERLSAAAGPEAEAALAYWRDRLTDAPPLLPLPIDCPRPALAGGSEADAAGATIARDLPPEGMARLLSIARGRGATPAMAFLAILAGLIARWTRAEDLVFALPVSKRSRPELTGLIGLLVDLLPIRVPVPSESRYETLVDAVRDAMMGAMQHSLLPFERIVDAARVPRQADAQPFQQVLFGFEAAEEASPDPDAETGSLIASEWQDLPEQDAKAALSVLVQPAGAGWRVALRYARSLFAEATAARLLDWFVALCRSAAERPAAPVGTLALAPPAEMRALLHRLNRTDRALPPGATLAGLFEATTAARPEAAALTVFAADAAGVGRTLDYGTLNRGANRLAHYLAARGIGPGQSVALAMPPGVAFITAMLAVVKLGAAYVPLDPALPAVRHAAMLEAAEVGVILLAGGELPRAVTEGRTVIDLLRAQTAIARADPANPAPRGDAASRAYIMFTSGSTGTPKGVAIPQRAIIRLVRNSDFLTIDPADSVGFASNVSFDASTLEIWGALLNGARLLQVPRDVLFVAAELARFIAVERLTVLWVTKGLFDQLVRSDPGVFRGLRVLLTGGDAASPTAFNQVLAASAGTGLTLLNGYGPTENTTFSAVWRAEGRLEEGRPVPIGRPIANSRAYVLDDAREPVPPGIVGELYVAGLGLAEGYVGRPDLTAERFLPDPFFAAGERMYRTGDLARLRDDGAIDYLGRIDDQVKIRGFRIELGDIAAVLARHPSLGASHVAVQEDGAFGKRLIAYAVPRSGEMLTPADLRAHLAANLPDFMLPKAILILPSLPLNANGKIDRRALPLPSEEAAETATPAEPPEGPTETALAEIWAQVLQRPDPARTDNFFHLGGDSILTIRVAARARERGLPVTPKLVFQHQTIAALAVAIDGLLAAHGSRPGLRVLPLTGSQYRLARLALPLAGDRRLVAPAGTPWVAGWARLARPIDAITFGLALQDLRRRHDALRLCLGGDESVRVLEMMDVPPPVPVSLHRLEPAGSDLGGEVARAAILAKLTAGLDMREGTVFRGALMREGGGPQHLLLLVHRLVADEASVALLLDELGRGIAEGRRARLASEAPPPFGRWIEAVAAYAASPDLARQIAEWDRPSRQSAAFRAENRTKPAAPPRLAARRLAPDLSAALSPAALVPRRISPLEVAVAALGATLEAHCPGAAATLLIDVVTDGRTRSFDDLDMAGMVGNFSRRFPLAVPAGDEGGALGRLARAKSALRDLPDGGLGFELLDRDLRTLPSSRVVLIDGLSAGPVNAAPVILQDAHVVGRPLVEAGDWIVLRLERDTDGLRLVCAVNGSAGPVDRPEDRLGDPARLAEAVCLWLDRLLLGAGTDIVQTPSDFPLAGLDQAGLLTVLSGQEAIEDIYPLSPMQESMLIHALTAPGSEIGFEQACHRIDGPLQVAAFQAAWQSAMDRHAILRTSFVWEGLSRPLQRVHARLRFLFRLDDWCDLPPAAQERRRAALLLEDRREGFRLDRPPLLRATIVRLGPEAFLFVSSYHHILLDGWCLPQLEREVRQAYEAAVDGQPYRGWAGRPYADYIAWLQRQDAAATRAYFAQLLAGWPGPTPLPDVSPPDGAPALARATLTVTEAEAQAVNRYARMARLTIGVLLHAAWGLVLMQLSGRRDVTFGTTVSGRPAELPGVETMLGLFINNLPVRLAITEDAPVSEVLAALQAQLLDLRQHEAASPLEIETFAPEPPEGCRVAPVTGRMFESLLVVENVPSSLHEWAASPTLRFTLLGSPLKTSYALTLVAIPGDGLRLSLVFDGRRFALPAVEAMLGEMRRLLLAMTSGGPSMAALLTPGLASAPSPPLLPAAGTETDAAEAADRVLPRNTVEVQVAGIVEAVLGVSPIGVTADLIGYGMTSVSVSRLGLHLRQAFGRAIPLTHIISHPTIAQLAAWLGTADSAALAWQPLVPMGGSAARRRFYCVHPIAGDVSVFFDLARAMAPTRRFVALQAPGLRPGDPEPDSVEALAALYVDGLFADNPDPIDIGGYSFGGVVAFEIARQMEARGRPPRSLVIIDTPAPSPTAVPEEEYSDAQWLWRMLRVRERFHGVDLALTLDDLERAGQQGGYGLALARLREAGLLPETADADLLLRMATVGRRHYRLYRRYGPRPIATPIAVIRAAELDASEAEIDHSGRFALADLGWAALTRGPVAAAVTPGNHVTLMRPPDLSALAATIERLLIADPLTAESTRSTGVPRADVDRA